MSEKTINLEINGRFFQAGLGETVLGVARREGIEIPTLCHHDALEPFGSCRLCVVEITHKDWKGWTGLVTACLYPVEEGLQVTTDNAEIATVRKTVLDLLLARCPGSDLIRRLAAAHGVTRTSYKKPPHPTTCILCGMCVRVCAAKGVHAIGTSGRGIEKKIAIPFRQAPPDCIGCASCAHICPTDTIRCEDTDTVRSDGSGGVRKIWGHSFEMAMCDTCGKPILPRKQMEYEAARSGLDESYFTVCASCSQAKTFKTIGSAFDMGGVE